MSAQVGVRGSQWLSAGRLSTAGLAGAAGWWFSGAPSGTGYFTDHPIKKSMSTHNLPVIAWGGLIGKTPSATSLGLRFDPIAAGDTGSV